MSRPGCSYGTGRRQYATVKFLLHNLLGGLLMLAALIVLLVYSARGGHPGTFLFSQLEHLRLGAAAQKWPFAMIRYCLGLFHTAAHWFTPLIIVVSVVGVLYAAVVTIGQADLRRLIAYLSVSGMGLITLGIFAMTSQDQAGAALQMVNHGFLVGALFLIADYGGVQKAAPMLAGLFLVP